MPVGNDVVDLSDPETAPSAPHRRFAERVCTAEELIALARSPDPNRLLWTYWAAKESAFKAMRKIAPAAPFSPRGFAVELHPERDGAVRHGAVRAGRFRFEVRFDHQAEHVHAVALVPNRLAESALEVVEMISAVHRMSRAEMAGEIAPPGDLPVASAAARRALRDGLAGRLGGPPERFVVVGRERGMAPSVFRDGFPLGVDVSLSHHGHLVAYAFALPRRLAHRDESADKIGRTVENCGLGLSSGAPVSQQTIG